MKYKNNNVYNVKEMTREKYVPQKYRGNVSKKSCSVCWNPKAGTEAEDMEEYSLLSCFLKQPRTVCTGCHCIQ